MATEAGPKSGPFSVAPRGLRVALRVQPGARHTRIDGPVKLADGRVVLKVRVGEPPEGGRANAAAIKLLAKAWGLPKGRLQVVAGAAERRKTLLVAGDPAELRSRLEAWLAGLTRTGAG